jgi:wyosine [tRNA(Phe)-imidazoG37] synthetase (radical SAM superfamily)
MTASPLVVDSIHPPDGLIYGPMDSARLGRTLGINLLGNKAKLCSFDCAYCDLGATEVRLNKLKDSGLLPSVEEVLSAAQIAFRQIHEQGPAIDALCISGNGEPTLHPDFPEIINGLIQLRDTWLPKNKISILTNGCNLDLRRMSDAVNKIDQRIVKIDAGNERIFKLVNTPLARVTLQKIIGGIRSLKDVTIQSMFHQGIIDNTGSSDIEDWIEVMALLKPKGIHIQGLSRKPHSEGLIRCDEDTLHTIASKLERRTGLKALIFP